MKFVPRVYQRKAIKFAIEHPGCGLFLDPGLGKTAVALAAFRVLKNERAVRRALVVAPLRVCHGVWPKERAKWDEFRSIRMTVLHGDEKDLDLKDGADVHVINPEGLGWLFAELYKRGGPWPYDWLIVDECFPAGTSITTPSGARAIETLKVGDLVSTSAGTRTIQRIGKRSTAELVELKLSNGRTLQCTPEHPIFTSDGWLPAARCEGRLVYENLERSGLPILQDQVHDQILDHVLYQREEVLLAILRSEVLVEEHVSQTVSCFEGEDGRSWQRSTVVEQRQAVVQSSPSTHVDSGEVGWPRLAAARWQWDRNNQARTAAAASAAIDVHLELRHKIGWQAAWLSYLLQSGLWQPTNETRDRGRRFQSSLAHSQGEGLQKRTEASRVRVESVAHIQCRGGVDVYNLQIKGCPHFYANGILVHNSTKFKNPRSQRFQLLKNHLGKFLRRTILTGTPTPNGLLDLFGQMYVVDGGRSLGRFITHYRNEFFYPSGFQGYEWKPQRDAYQRIMQRVRPVTLSMEAKDWLELPQRIDNTVAVDLPAGAMKVYRELEREMIVQLNSKTVLAVNAGVVSMKCRQLANGGVYAAEDDVVEIHEAKVDALEELIESLQGSPLLVAYEFKHDLARIRRRLGPKTPAYTGGMSAKEAQRVEDAWNAGDLPVLLAQPQSAAWGPNLQESGHTICWFSNIWDYEPYHQFNLRVLRQGQKAKRVVIHHLVARGTVDELIREVVGQKHADQRALLRLLKERYRAKAA